MARLARSGSICVIVLLLLSCNRVYGQTDDGGLWLALFSQGNLRSDCECQRDLKWWFDGHARFNDDAEQFNQGIARPGIGVPLTERATLWAGYAWIRTLPLGGMGFNENRIWQQVTWSNPRDSVTLAFRSRLEQRFLETGDDVGWRFRQLVRMQHDLPARPRLAFVSWDEMFFHLNDTDWGARSGFDQNRLFVGFGWRRDPDRRWRIEMGYLNQFVYAASGTDRTNHLLSVNFYRSP